MAKRKKNEGETSVSPSVVEEVETAMEKDSVVAEPWPAPDPFAGVDAFGSSDYLDGYPDVAPPYPFTVDLPMEALKEPPLMTETEVIEKQLEELESLRTANKALSMHNAALNNQLSATEADLATLRETQSRFEDQLVNVTRMRDELEAQVASLEVTVHQFEDKNANLSFTLAERNNWIGTIKASRLFTVTPIFMPGQAKETRRFVLAKDMGEAIRKVTADGKLSAADISNTTIVSEHVLV